RIQKPFRETSLMAREFKIGSMRQVLRHENPKEVPRDKSCGTKIQKRFQETSLAARKSKRGSVRQFLRHENPKLVPRDRSCGMKMQKPCHKLTRAKKFQNEVDRNFNL